jgi:hypothetical protein
MKQQVQATVNREMSPQAPKLAEKCLTLKNKCQVILNYSLLVPYQANTNQITKEHWKW